VSVKLGRAPTGGIDGQREPVDLHSIEDKQQYMLCVYVLLQTNMESVYSMSGEHQSGSSYAVYVIIIQKERLN
jgi:hypothetical protein